MTFGQSPHAALDAVVRQARYLLFAFDGPIRSVDTGKAADPTTVTAPPAPYIHDVLAACRESGCSAAVVTTTPVAEVRAYLDAHDLSAQITIVAASIGQAASALDASPADFAVITSASRDVEAAKAAGVPTITYAKTHDDAEHQAATGATAVVYSMANVALRLRALPLPS